ncbi:hypothetical protein WICPIJ_006059 [Wickerhamomyces pijperi]|uniref:Nuclear pore protein n=1 Tax=Wickerhamomyces pijperi TaxID=599730 RepID=A0A9P8Q2X6_WICPI|nr:hypothetical protein WICPIJ_006059 [Wickerhamomyces pijperi]
MTTDKKPVLDKGSTPVSAGRKLINELLESSKSLPHVITNESDLGSIQLGINEIRKKAYDLRKAIRGGSASSVAGAGVGSAAVEASIENNAEDLIAFDNLTKAHYLLAGKVSFEDIQFNIKSLESIAKSSGASKTSTGNCQAIGRTSGSTVDLDSYLRRKKEENILSSIEQSLSIAASDFDSFVSQNINLDWKQRRDEVREAFGIVLTKQSAHTDGENAMKKSKVIKHISWGKSFKLLNDQEGTEGVSSKLNVNENTLIRGKFERYARLVNKLNDFRQSSAGGNNSKETVFDYANEVSEFFKNGSDSKSKQLFDSWKIISNFKSIKDQTGAAVNGTENINAKILAHSKRFLELQFFEYVDNIYKTKIMDKGLPKIINKVKCFIEYQKLNSNGNLLVVNGIPIWALIFYLLRCGCEKEALELVEENISVFKKVEQSFVVYFRAYVNSVDKRLSEDLTSKIQNEFNNHIKKSVDGDPYRYSVYKILARCQISRKENISQIALTSEDWLWMHLMLAKESDDCSELEPIHERYTLKDFQMMILSYGEGKFVNNYLQVLLLSGLFEEASKFAISKINEIDGIHLTIALAYYQLLPASFSGKLSKIMATYIRSFKFSDPRIAVEYLVLICLFSNEVETCHETLRELILETKEFSILLGKVNSKGVRIPGKIEDRKALVQLENDFLTKVTEQAAITADKEGRVFDGLLLYQLAEEYEIVITIINKMLGEYLSSEYSSFDNAATSATSSNVVDETDPVSIAENFLKLYSLKVSSRAKSITYKLLQIAQIKQKYQSKTQIDDCLRLIESLEILPINFASPTSTDLNEIRTKTEDLTYLADPILKNVPSLLIILMQSITLKREQLVTTSLNLDIRDEKLKELKIIAKNCIVFAGMVQYKMPRETFSLLISLEAKL